MHMFPMGHQHQGQHQDSDQAQLQLQAELQAQLQGQGQHQESENDNENANLNENHSGSHSGSMSGAMTGAKSGSHSDSDADAAANAATSSASASNAATTNMATNTNANSNATTVDVAVDLTGYEPTDDDFADFDLASGASIDSIVMAKGNLDYDPGNDMSLSKILTDALDGEGNDTGIVNAMSNNLQDNDTLHNATVGGNLQQTNNSAGGHASASEGINAESDGGKNDGTAVADGAKAIAGEAYGGWAKASGGDTGEGGKAKAYGGAGADGGDAGAIGVGLGIGGAASGAKSSGGDGQRYLGRPWSGRGYGPCRIGGAWRRHR
jgi:hypothetical protein